MKKIFRWFSLLLSDSNKISSRRFIALQAFYLIVATLLISIASGNVQLANIEIIKQIELHLYYITLLGIFGVTATNLAQIIKSSTPSQSWSSYEEDEHGTQKNIDVPENP